VSRSGRVRKLLTRGKIESCILDCGDKRQERRTRTFGTEQGTGGGERTQYVRIIILSKGRKKGEKEHFKSMLTAKKKGPAPSPRSFLQVKPGL